MGLFTTPLTVNDGASDRIFDFAYQALGSVLGGIYNEPLATAGQASVLRTSHTTAKSGQERHMIQRSENAALVSPSASDPTSDDIIVNITVSHHPKHALADVEKQLNIALAAAGVTGFTAKLMTKNI
jgi:hypothetical protein